MREKKWRVFVIAGFLIMGVFFMMDLGGCSNGIQYASYSSIDKELNVAMDYIAGWDVKEHRGVGYASVLFLEKRVDGGYQAGVNVTVKNKASVKPEISSPASMADAFVAQKLKLREARLLKRSPLTLGYAAGAEDLLFSYTLLDKLYSLDAKPIAAQERIVIFKRGDMFYIVSYQSAQKDFYRFDKAFTRCLKSLRFKFVS